MRKNTAFIMAALLSALASTQALAQLTFEFPFPGYSSSTMNGGGQPSWQLLGITGAVGQSYPCQSGYYALTTNTVTTSDPIYGFSMNWSLSTQPSLNLNQCYYGLNQLNYLQPVISGSTIQVIYQYPKQGGGYGSLIWTANTQGYTNCIVPDSASARFINCDLASSSAKHKK